MLVLIVSCLSTNNHKIYQFNMYMLELLLQVKFVIIMLISGNTMLPVHYSSYNFLTFNVIFYIFINISLINQIFLIQALLVLLYIMCSLSTIKLLFNNFLVNGAKTTLYAACENTDRTSHRIKVRGIFS